LLAQFCASPNKSQDARSVFSSNKERTVQVGTTRNGKLAKYRVFVQASTERMLAVS